MIKNNRTILLIVPTPEIHKQQGYASILNNTLSEPSYLRMRVPFSCTEFGPIVHETTIDRPVQLLTYIPCASNIFY